MEYGGSKGVDSQIGATNTDVDDGVDFLVGVALPLAAAHLLGELFHVLEDAVDTLNDALSVDLHLLFADIAEGDVVNSTVLGEVDLLTRKHLITELLKPRLLRELDEQLQGLIGDEVLGEVEQRVGLVCFVVKCEGELIEALRVLFEVLLQDNVFSELLVVLLQSTPSREIRGLRESRHCAEAVVSQIWRG
jgi:hypothetical protein